MGTYKPNVVWTRASGESLSLVTDASGFTIDNAPRSSDALFLYFDESGNLDFGRNGTSHFIITCAVARRPFNAAAKLSDYRYDLFEDGMDIQKLHACEDNERVRTRCYDILASSPREYRVYAAYVEKQGVPDEFRTPDAIYSKLFESLMDEISRRERVEGTKRVIAITDALPKDAVKRQVTKPLKKYMRDRFQRRGIPYTLMHHESASDMNLQAVDYYCWAVHRSIVKGRDWPYSKVEKSFAELGEVSFHEAVRNSGGAS